MCAHQELAMAGSSNRMTLPETSRYDHRPLDLANLILQGSIHIEWFKELCDQTNIDIPNQDGKTPLIVACLKGLKNIVKFLLDKGANPNYQCPYDGNTPLHFACLREQSIERATLRVSYLPSDEESTIAIIRHLLTHGARVHRNNDGLTSTCIAGLYGLKSVVEFFFTSDQVEVPYAEKVRSLELLGVAESVIGAGAYRYNVNRAHEAFCRALEYRESSSEELVEGKTNSNLANCFIQSGAKECVSLNEMLAIKHDENAIRVHSFLVGDRVLPESQKEEKLWPQVLEYAITRGSYYVDRHILGCEIFKHARNLESTAHLNLGLVTHYIRCSFGLGGQREADVLYFVESLIASYAQVLMTSDVMHHFGELLLTLTLFYPHSEIHDSILSSIVDVVKLIHQAQNFLEHERTSQIASLSHTIIRKLPRAFRIAFRLRLFNTWKIKRVKYVVSRLLCCEDVTFIDKEKGETMLHTLVCLLSAVVRFMSRSITEVFHCIDYSACDYVMDFARMLINHGCPVNVRNNVGKAARDLLTNIEDVDPDDPSLKELFHLLSPPTSALRLEEMAARKILQARISYHQTLPPALCKIVERGTC